jgi:hypothetical protein
MSKDSSSSGKLLGTIKFVFDVTKSRNLNATQAYDTSTTQIVLANYPATATKKALAPTQGKVLIGLTGVPAEGAIYVAGTDNLEDSTKSTLASTAAGIISLTYRTTLDSRSTVGFQGSYEEEIVVPANTKNIFNGSVIVGTGEYRDWQGKYGVLKVDLLTNNAVLRVYDE